MIKYSRDESVQQRMERVVMQKGLNYVDTNRILCFRSRGTKSERIIARCWPLPRIWQKALGKEPHYVIEVISERFDSLDEKTKDEVIFHELMHIPEKFTGGLRHHKQLKRAMRGFK